MIACFFLWTWRCFLHFSWCVKRPITYAWNCFRERYRGPSLLTNFPDYEGKIRYSRNHYVTRIKGGFTFAVVGYYLSFHDKQNSSILLLNKFKFRLPSFPRQFRWRGKTGIGGGGGSCETFVVACHSRFNNVDASGNRLSWVSLRCE